MANPITWRNVEAPDFRSSMAGISEFGRLFGNATGGLAGALDGFQKDQMASADREVAARALAIQNPQAFQSALADGSLIGGAAPSVEQLRSLQTGVGNLVDADLAKESARLQALQVQQQLGAQALSIANSAPQIVLSLFRNG